MMSDETEKRKSPTGNPVSSDKTDGYRNPCMGLEFDKNGDNPSPADIADALKWINHQIDNASSLGVKNVSVYETIRAALKAQQPDVNQELLEALKRIRINIQCRNPSGYTNEDKLEAILFMAKQAIASAEQKGGA